MTRSLSELAGFLIDMDGVLYRGNEPLPGMQEFVAHLRTNAVPHAFVTNNAGRTPEEYARQPLRRRFAADTGPFPYTDHRSLSR